MKYYQPVAEVPDNPFLCALDGGKYMSRKVLERRRLTRFERFPHNPRQIKSGSARRPLQLAPGFALLPRPTQESPDEE